MGLSAAPWVEGVRPDPPSQYRVEEPIERCRAAPGSVTLLPRAEGVQEHRLGFRRQVRLVETAHELHRLLELIEVDVAAVTRRQVVPEMQVRDLGLAATTGAEA